MNWIENILYILKGQMETPTSYGWFHFMFIGIILLTTILICFFFKNCKEKTFKVILFVGWIIIVLFEIYKEIIYSFDYDPNNNLVTWKYQWYIFPFQFCSTPFYVLPFAIFFKKGKIQQSAIAFISTFVLFGGIAVYIYPNDVFVRTIGINIQTMVHHGLMIVLGIFCLVYKRKEINLLYFLKAIPVYLICITTAIILNLVVHQFINDTFNMFFISPYFKCTLPILSIIYQKCPYIIFLFIYLFGFILVSFIMNALFFGIYKLSLTINKRIKLKNS